MRDLNFDLKRLQKDHDDGPHGTRTARSCALAQIADLLHDLGFTGLWATGLRRKHVAALVKDPHVAMALRLEAEFGLRREEAIKFTPINNGLRLSLRYAF